MRVHNPCGLQISYEQLLDVLAVGLAADAVFAKAIVVAFE